MNLLWQAISRLPRRRLASFLKHYIFGDVMTNSSHFPGDGAWVI
jgi:hypothetical protein